MNAKRYVASVVAVLIGIFVFDFLVHGVLLKGSYEATKQLWRPESEANMAFMFLSQVGFAAMVSFLFTLNYEGKGVGEGIRFGLVVAGIMSAHHIGKYCYMPIPMALMLSWVGAEIIKGLIYGTVLSLVYRKD